MARQHLFVSYAHADALLVHSIVRKVQRELRSRGTAIDLWLDMERLAPGQSWDTTIADALSESVGMLVFVSPHSVESFAVGRQIRAAAKRQGVLILPVILKHVSDLPRPLADHQAVDLSHMRGMTDLKEGAQKLADAVESYVTNHASLPRIAPDDALSIGAEIAERVREMVKPSLSSAPSQQSIFLVHGHDAQSKSHVEQFLIDVGIKPVVLSKVGGAAQSLLQKFLSVATEARFAIVLLSADDVGASRIQYDEPQVGDRALQFRSRQNVILELGFFYGHLGWENVFVLQGKPDRVFPNFERPSDLDGVVFDAIDSSNSWQQALASRLSEAGFRLAARST